MASILDSLQNQASNVSPNSAGDLMLSVGNAVPGVSDLIGNSAATAVSLKNFLRTRQIDGTRWNKVFPYTVSIGQFASNSNSSNVAQSPISNLTQQIASNLGPNPQTTFGNLQNSPLVLPIGPQNITVSTPSASNISVTLRGIIEEHNGAPLRNIRISGTTGITPLRDKTFYNPDSTNPNGIGALASSIFANTIQSAQNLINTVNGTGLVDSDLFAADVDDNRAIGYMFFQQMVNFFDAYLSLKKQKANKDYYLIFQMEKDQIYYRCSLRNFTFSKRPGTLEYDYTIDFVAWGYEDDKSSTNATSLLSDGLNFLQQAIATIKKARSVIAASQNIISSVQQDITNVLQVANEALLFAQDAVGVGQSIAEMPSQIAQSFESLVIQQADNLSTAWSALETSYGNLFGKGTTAQTIANQTQQSPQSAVPTSSSINVRKIFANSLSYPDFFSAIPINSLQDIPQPLQDKVSNEIFRVQSIDTSTWQQTRDTIVNTSNSLANAFGVGDPTVNAILGFNGKQSAVAITDAQYAMLKNIQDIISSLNQIIVSKRNSDQAIQSYANYYVSLAQANGIALVAPQGKFAVPVPYGANLQNIAVQYLGDPDRWPEIAAINQLRSPFIDEDGFTVQIVGPTNGQILSTSTADNLYIGQPILLSQNNGTTLAAKIASIQQINETLFFIGIDQIATGFNQSVGAFFTAHLPNTVNSGMLIYIPTATQPTVLGSNYQYSPSIVDQGTLSMISGSDILLSSSGDIVTLPTGDVKIATGMANLIQAATLKLVTPLGSLITHPAYGLGILPGTPTTEFNARTTLTNIEKSFSQDNRYQSVLAARVQKNGPVASISVILGINNGSSVLPLSVTVPGA